MGVHMNLGDVVHMQFFLSGVHYFQHLSNQLHRLEIDVSYFAPALQRHAWQIDTGIIDWTGACTSSMIRWRTRDTYTLTVQQMLRAFSADTTMFHLFAIRFKAIVDNVAAQIIVGTPRAYTVDGTPIMAEVLHGNMIAINKEPTLSLSYSMMTRMYAFTQNTPVYPNTEGD